MCIDQRADDRRQRTEFCRAFCAESQEPAYRAGNNLSSVFCPLSYERGVSLVELIVFIIIISVALAGILLVMNQTTGHGADALMRKQALAVAESLLEEVELQDFISASGVTAPVTQANRATVYHIVNDYNGFSMTGISPLSGAAIPSLGSYNASVSVASTALGSIAAGSAVRITVTVADPQGNQVAIDGYRTAY